MEFLPAAFFREWPSRYLASQICLKDRHPEPAIRMEFCTVDELRERWTVEMGSVQDFLDYFVAKYPRMAESVEDSNVPLSADAKWTLSCCYHGWAKQQILLADSKEEFPRINAVLQDLKQRAHRRIVEAEAARVCLPLQDLGDDGSACSALAPGNPNDAFGSLPDSILHQIFTKLELFDLSYAVCVCWEWRRAGLDYLRRVKKVEHAFTTHMLRRRHCLSPDNVQHTLTYWLNDWRHVSRHLTQWTAGVCEGLETLVMTAPLPRSMLQSVLDACPMLKNIVVTLLEEFVKTDGVIGTQPLNLRNLECIVVDISIRAGNMEYLSQYPQGHSLMVPEGVSVLCASRSHGYTDMCDDLSLHRLIAYDSLQPSTWSKLVALEWIISENFCLEDIINIRCWRLRYLHLQLDGQYVDVLDSSVADFFLRSCPELSVLILGDLIVAADTSLQIMRECCPQLQTAWLVNNDLENRFTPSSLQALEEAMKNRGLPTTDINIVALQDEVLEFSRAAPSFTYIREEYSSERPPHFTLHHRQMRRFLGLDF